MNEKTKTLNKCYQIINLLENNISDKYNMPEVMKRLPWESPEVIQAYVDSGAEISFFLAYANSTDKSLGRFVHLELEASNENHRLTEVETGEYFYPGDLDCVVAL